MPEMCADMFPEFEQLACIGCHFRQPYVMTKDPEDDSKGTIRLCKTFARNLYGNEDLEAPTEKYDSCGLIIPDPDDSDSVIVVIPSEWEAWQTAKGFFNDDTIKPPLFKGYEVELVEDSDDCFNQGMKLGLSALAAMSVAIYTSF